MSEEIKRIREDLNIDEIGLPAFWFRIQKSKNGFGSKFNPGEVYASKDQPNPDLVCPMNFIDAYSIPRKGRRNHSRLPNNQFYFRFPLNADKKQAVCIEKMIHKYSVERYVRLSDYPDFSLEKAFFEELIEDLKRFPWNDNYEGIMSWIINRILCIDGKSQNEKFQSALDKNRPLVLNALYRVNSEAFLKCFSKNLMITDKTVFLK